MPNAKDFDLTNPIVVIRLMAGLLYVPHALFKITGFAGSLAAFGAMGFQPPLFWVSLAILVEAICAVGLTFTFYTRYVGLTSVRTMVLAAYGTFMTNAVHCMWNFG